MNVYNAAERAHVKAAAKAAKAAERERTEIIKGLMSLAAGRSWVLEKLESCHVFATSFGTNALQMAFNEGERNIGLRLLNDVMAACPEQYVLMMRERNERELAADSRRSRDSSNPDGGDRGPDGDEDRDAGGSDEAGNQV